MKSTLRSLFVLAAFLISGVTLNAQITGTITVPSTLYPDLATIITALNTQGVGTGGAIINLTAANPQTTPGGGYLLGSAVLNASTSATKTLVFNGNANIITAGTGLGATDAFFKISGVDYVTFSNFNLQEAAANTTAVTKAENGFQILNRNSAAPFDGSQYVTIQNCTIQLDKTNTNATTGIYTGHITAASTAALTITDTLDTHSYIKIYGNNISNVISGVRMEGFAAPAPFTLYDKSNEVGGATLATGNTITNQGGLAAFNMFGILMLNQTGGRANYNTYNPALGNRGNNTQSIAIYGSGLDWTATNNNIKLVTASGTSTVAGIYGLNTGNLTATNNTVEFIDSAGSGTHYGVVASALLASVVTDNTFKATTAGATSISAVHYHVFLNNGTTVPNSVNISRNTFDGINVLSTGTHYLIFAQSLSPNVTINNNKVVNGFTRTGAGQVYGIINPVAPYFGNTVITGNNFSGINNTSASVGIYFPSITAQHTVTVSNDTFSNWNAGIGQFFGIYLMGGAGHVVNNNIVSNFTTTYATAACAGIAIGNTGNNPPSTVGINNPSATCFNNLISGLANSGNSQSGILVDGAPSIVKVYNNRISDITANTAAGIAHGINVNNGFDVSLYNNMISDIKTPIASNPNTVNGIFINAGTRVSAYYNTINISPVSTGTNFGATGIFYSSAAGTVDLRNNIVRLIAAPAGTGTVVALRRSTGTAGTAPVNLDVNTNGNILYTPTATNTYLYGEGTSTTMINGFNLTSDPGFNTSCGLYKKFMAPRESATFTEDNLAQVGTLPVFAPTGASYAEGGAVPVAGITTDYSGVTRPTPGDIGALQFAGTVAGDVAPPVINYTPLSLTSYCTTPPVLVATITDVTGVNNTTGTSPRLYYKKSTDANDFAVANTSAGNGWKWVEATISGSTYTFTFDYTKLQAALAVGDSITYFVVAQDTRPTPNVGASIAGFPAAYCPASVALPAAAGPIAATNPTPSGFKIVAVPAFTATASPRVSCGSGTTTLTASPLPAGSTIQWQQDNGTGTYVNIAGATSTTYTTGTNTATNRFRAQIYCGASVVATSTSDTLTVSSPQVLTTAPGSRCGVGTVNLGATTTTGYTLNWYAAATGGTSLGTGTSFTTPSITATTNFYVGASLPISAKRVTVGTDVTVTSPTTQPTAFCNRWPAYTSQTIYTAAELTALGLVAGNITGMGFTTTTLGDGATNANYTIKIGHTALTTAPTTFVTTGFTTVFPAQTYTHAPFGLHTFNFSTPFNWDGTSNIIVEIKHDGANSTNNAQTYYSTTAASMTSTATTVGATTGTLTTQRLNTLFIGNGRCESPRTLVTATVGPPPPVTASATPTAGICPGGTATVSVTSSNPGYTWSWATGQTTSSFTVSPTVTTKYIVTATDPVTSCVAKDSVTVTVIIQAATITPSATQNICPGNSVLLTANTGTGLGYEWFKDGVSQPGGTTSTFSANAQGVYTVKVTNLAAGCSATSTGVTVNVVPAPTAVITPSGNVTLCTGSTLTLSAATGTGYTYQWKLGTANATGTSTTATYTASLGGAYTVVVSANGCSTTSAPTNVTILPLPLAVMSPSAPATACDSVVLSSTNTGVIYQWNYNSAPILGASGSTYAAPLTGNYSLTTTSTSNGCSATSPAVAITVNQSPAANITYSSPITFCEGSAVVLNTYTGANLSYEWRNSNVPIVGANTNTYTSISSGTYTVRVANTVNGCARVSAPIIVTVNPKPVPVITYNNVSNVLSTTQPFAQYQWVMDGLNIAGATQRNYSPTKAGAFHVIVVDTNGCTNQSQIFFVNNVGIAANSLGKLIRIYPNPTSGLLHVNAPMNIRLTLRDITGKTVLQGDEKTDLDLQSIADGMYLLYITDNSGQLIRAEKITKSSR